MSSGLEYEEIEWNPGQWYWIRQSDNCPANCWDWREYNPDVVGPFPTREALFESYHDHETNTGGGSITEYQEALHSDEVLAKLIAEAEHPDQRYRNRYGRW